MVALPRFFFGFFLYSSLFISMASSSTVPCVSEMVELRANGLEIPILCPLDAYRFAFVSSLHLSNKFLLQDNTIWVEREICDSATSLFSLTMRGLPTTEHQCRNSALVNTRCMDSQILAQMYRQKSVPFSIPHLLL